MDPNEALKNLRDTIGLATALSDGDPVDFTAEQILADMTEDVQALDEWLSKGGFLPTDWRMSRRIGRGGDDDGGMDPRVLIGGNQDCSGGHGAGVELESATGGVRLSVGWMPVSTPKTITE